MLQHQLFQRIPLITRNRLASRKSHQLRHGEQIEKLSLHDVARTSVKTISNLVATEIERGRYGLAYHLTLARPEIFPNASTIKLIACNYVTDERAPVAAYLPDLAAKLAEEAAEALNKETGPLAQVRLCRRDRQRCADARPDCPRRTCRPTNIFSRDASQRTAVTMGTVKDCSRRIDDRYSITFGATV